jgi:hypothetical protein
MNNDQPQPPSVVAHRLANAWSALLALLILWVLFASSATLGFGVLGWSIGAGLIARQTYAAVGDVRWLTTARRIRFGALLLFVAQVLLLPPPIGLLLWFPFLVVVPPRTTVRALRVLRSTPASTPPRPSRWARLRTVSLGLVVGVATCAPTGALHILARSSVVDDQDTQSFGGCYKVATPVWIRWQGRFAMIPERLQLDTARGSVVKSADPSLPYVARNEELMHERGEHLIRPGWWRGTAVWQAHSPRTLSLTWSTGHSGADAMLHRIGGNLVGQIDGFIDVDPAIPESALIWLHPIDCTQVPMDTTR